MVIFPTDPNIVAYNFKLVPIYSVNNLQKENHKKDYKAQDIKTSTGKHAKGLVAIAK